MACVTLKSYQNLARDNSISLHLDGSNLLWCGGHNSRRFLCLCIIWYILHLTWSECLHWHFFGLLFCFLGCKHILCFNPLLFIKIRNNIRDNLAKEKKNHITQGLHMQKLDKVKNKIKKTSAPYAKWAKVVSSFNEMPH